MQISMASWSTYVQAFVYIGLLFFLIPIRIKGPDQVELQFQEYLTKFNKSYSDDLYNYKLQAFKKSIETINLLNANKTNGSAHYGLTKFSDLFPEEFLKTHLNSNGSTKSEPQPKNEHHREKWSTLARFIDWRKKNVVTEVHDQGTCGACWAYSVVETIESMNGIKTNKTEDLSVQEIIDCAGYGNTGCGGGDVCTLLNWMKDTNFTLNKKRDYPKKGHHCQGNSHEGVQVERFVCESFVGLEHIMLELLAENGPLAVGINAQTWQNYIGGVIQYHCDGSEASLNHAAQIVGYNLDAAIPYYIVRNSWGKDFGDHGYLYIAIDDNVCGIANEVSALTVL